ncbi:MAG TPA: PHP domain-containing protein, partial [Solirubrobacteraceae bacterium]|nr:PHP domain-containing protein [Solirubrobacteraceae bacterium]
MAARAEYVELHCHSAYSFLDGASLPEELVERAAEHGYGALALTDHDSLAGALEFSACARELGLRAILGAELTVAGTAGAPTPSCRHLTLLVRDRDGWRNLCRLLTAAHAHTRDAPQRRPLAPRVELRDVLEHANGLLCLSGCASHGVDDEPTLRRLREAFGAEWLRVELQRPYARGDRARNRMRERLAHRLELATVATGNVHAHSPARAQLQDALVAIRHGMTLDASEAVRRPNHTHVLATPAGMVARFAEHP